jgi:hypothetical protein
MALKGRGFQPRRKPRKMNDGFTVLGKNPILRGAALAALDKTCPFCEGFSP